MIGRTVAFVAFAIPVLSGPVTGQTGSWTVGVTLSGAYFRGASAEGASSRGGLQFVPYRPTFYGVYAEHGSTVRVGLRVATGSSGVSLEDRKATEGSAGRLRVVSDDGFEVFALGISATAPIVRGRGGAAVRIGGGGHWERWSAPGGAAQGLAGVDGIARVEVPLGRRWLAHGAVGASYDPTSPFATADLPEGFRPIGMWRWGLGTGIGYRW